MILTSHGFAIRSFLPQYMQHCKTYRLSRHNKIYYTEAPRASQEETAEFVFFRPAFGFAFSLAYRFRLALRIAPDMCCRLRSDPAIPRFLHRTVFLLHLQS